MDPLTGIRPFHLSIRYIGQPAKWRWLLDKKMSGYFTDLGVASQRTVRVWAECRGRGLWNGKADPLRGDPNPGPTIDDTIFDGVRSHRAKDTSSTQITREANASIQQ